MPAQLSHHRLAWLAMRDHCEKRARRRSLFDWMTILFAGRYDAVYSDDFDLSRAYGQGHNRDLLRQGRNDKLMHYGIAVDTCADRLDAEDIATLRRGGQLPPWFAAAVDEEYAALRKGR